MKIFLIGIIFFTSFYSFANNRVIELTEEERDELNIINHRNMISGANQVLQSFGIDIIVPTSSVIKNNKLKFKLPDGNSCAFYYGFVQSNMGISSIFQCDEAGDYNLNIPRYF